MTVCIGKSTYDLQAPKLMFGKKNKSNDFSPNSFSYRGSYFKYRGEGSQILWIRFGGVSGRVLSEVSSDICMGEGLQIFWIRFGSAKAEDR